MMKVALKMMHCAFKMMKIPRVVDTASARSIKGVHAMLHKDNHKCVPLHDTVPAAGCALLIL